MNFSSMGTRRAALVLAVLFVIPTVLFGMRTIGSFRLLRSACEAGAPATSSVRAWMTLAYVTSSYHVDAAGLIGGLGLPRGADPNLTIKAAAEKTGASPYQYIQRVQRLIAAQQSNGTTSGANEGESWLRALSDQVLSALLVYGYPSLGLSVLFGSAGLPLPQGLLTIVAGSLAAQGRMNWIAAGGITVIASVLGDAVDYGCGLLLGRKVLRRYGRWFGLTPTREESAELLFERWALATVFVTRTFVSNLSTAASLLAGVSHYSLSRFIAIVIVGRAIWTAAYLGLGYVIGADLEAAAGFLGNFSGFLFCAMALVASGSIAKLSRDPS